MEINGLNMAVLYSFRGLYRYTPAVTYSHAQATTFEHQHAQQGMQ